MPSSTAAMTTAMTTAVSTRPAMTAPAGTGVARWPPDSLVPSAPAFSVRPTKAMVSSISRGARYNPAYKARHSRTDRPGSGSDSCKTMPTRSRQAPSLPRRWVTCFLTVLSATTRSRAMR